MIRPLPEVIAAVKRSPVITSELVSELVAAAEAHMETVRQREAEWQASAKSDHEVIVDLTAQLAQAVTAVPEPLAVGEVAEATGGQGRLYLHLVAPANQVSNWSWPKGKRVGIWPADRAGQVADHAQDEEGWRREADAALAVAKRFRDGMVPSGDEWVLLPEHRTNVPHDYTPVTDAERDVLDRLEQSDDTD